jgi:hypothetical protein
VTAILPLIAGAIYSAEPFKITGLKRYPTLLLIKKGRFLTDKKDFLPSLKAIKRRIEGYRSRGGVFPENIAFTMRAQTVGPNWQVDAVVHAQSSVPV